MNFLKFMQSNWRVVLDAFNIHLKMSFISVAISIIIAIPFGMLLSRLNRTAKIVLAIVGIIQTIPGLVMLGIGLMLFGLGTKSAIFVFIAYAILPVMQNTYTGITGVDKNYIEIAKGIGMSNMQILFMIQSPIAMPAIVAGIRISVVYIISWATLAALIGAGGLGDLIWTGLSSYDTNMILAGAIPASLLAVFSGIIIDFIQKAVIPRGMRIKGDNNNV